jgi:signal transduction histidine kinase
MQLLAISRMIHLFRALVKNFKAFLRRGRTRPVFVYSFSVFVTLFSFLLISLLLNHFQDISPLLFLLFPVVVNAAFGGLRSGILSIFTGLLALLALFLIPKYQSLLTINEAFFIECAFYVFIGVGASYIIDHHSRHDKSVEYEKVIQGYIQLLSKLERRYQKAVEEITARDEFLAVASHELKTPVTSMLLQVQLALHNIKHVSLAKFSVSSLLQMLDSTEQQSKRLAKMVNDLLNTSLITTGRLELEREDEDLAQIVRDVSLPFADKMKKEDKTLVVSAEKPIRGKFDKVRIEQVVSNLLSNAIKYGNGKPVRVSVSNSNSIGTIVVQDQGIGISKDQQERIFKRFARAANGKEYRGLGVGLYITDQIVRAHKGAISLESKPGKGTKFTITLPLGKN